VAKAGSDFWLYARVETLAFLRFAFSAVCLALVQVIVQADSTDAFFVGLCVFRVVRRY
jgi:hypothetical protein